MSLQDSLSDTIWDAVIFGTGITESLIAAALSKAGKKILHLDVNEYYGGSHASFSLDELKSWVQEGNTERVSTTADVKTPEHACPTLSNRILEIPNETASKFGKSRDYTLSLSPQILYASSSLLPLLVRGQLHHALEFLKVGSWFVYAPEDSAEPNNTDYSHAFRKVPNGREDVFLDKSIDLKTKRALVKVLKNAALASGDSWPPSNEGPAHGSSFESVLTSAPNSLPSKVVPLVTALTMSYQNSSELTAAQGLQYLRRHLSSIGRLGPGFGAVLARYGTATEVVQVLCRAAAVAGGGVYILGAVLDEIKFNGSNSLPSGDAEAYVRVTLKDKDPISAKHIIGHPGNFSYDPSVREMIWREMGFNESLNKLNSKPSVRRAVYIVSAPLLFLFESEEPPHSSGAIIYFPRGTVSTGEGKHNNDGIYIVAHSSDTGQCPKGQCVLYVTMQILSGESVDDLLLQTAQHLIRCKSNTDLETSDIIMSLYYTCITQSLPENNFDNIKGKFFMVSDAPSLDMVIPESVVHEAINVYEQIVGSQDGFMDAVSDLQEEHDDALEIEAAAAAAPEVP